MALAVVKNKKRMDWFLGLVMNLNRLPKQGKDLQSLETEPEQPELGVSGSDVVTYGVGTSSALELVSPAIIMWKSDPECDSSYLKWIPK